MDAQGIFEQLVEHCRDVPHALQVTEALLLAGGQPKVANAVNLASAAPVSSAISQLLSMMPAAMFSASAAGGTLLKGVDTVGQLAKNLGPLALAATVGPGYLGGHLVAKAMDVDNSDVTEIQEQELIDELRANADQARKQRALREV